MAGEPLVEEVASDALPGVPGNHGAVGEIFGRADGVVLLVLLLGDRLVGPVGGGVGRGTRDGEPRHEDGVFVVALKDKGRHSEWNCVVPYGSA